MKDGIKWLVTADGRGATLFSCSHTPKGELHLEPVRSLKNAHEGDHEHHRPSLLGGSERQGGKNYASSHAAPHSVAPGHEVEEGEQRFVKDVKEWLGGATKDLGISRMCVFASPRLLGGLRRHIRASADFHEAELTHLSTGQLAAHPAVKVALEQPLLQQKF